MRNKKKKITLFLSMFLLIASMIMTVQAETVDEDVKEARNGVLQIRLMYEGKDGQSGVLGGGSAFLISEDTILTSYHVVVMDEDSENYASAVETFGADFSTNDIKLEVVVMNDVTLEAKVLKTSQQYDFAVLELEQPIYDRTPLVLNSDDNVSETQQVYALGFPDTVAAFQNQNSYTYQDVTIADGRVTKSTESDGVKYVQHSAILTEGYSGGPLVAEDGSVIAINRGYLTEYNYSVSISQIREVLDALGITYDTVTSSAPVVDDEPDEIETKPQEDLEDETTKAPSVSVDDIKNDIDSDADEDSDEVDDEGMSSVMLIAIIAVVVVVLLIIIILIATLGKKKSPEPAQIPRSMQGQPPINVMTPPVNQMTPPAPPQNNYYSNEGAGATTVLNEGAGETTVLGGSSMAGSKTLIRIKTGESISVNRPEFTLGKERRRVDYCISDNNSVSRVHAKLVNRGGQTFLMDMNATNGTFVNGTKLSPNQEVRLSTGDKFKLADEEFQIQG